MRITDRIRDGKVSLSFEIFPPKTDMKLPEVRAIADEIASLDPSFMSITFGAGGSTAGRSEDLASHLIARGTNVLFHLTCVHAAREEIRKKLDQLNSIGIENILALRGDLPEGVDDTKLDFRHAVDLIHVIREYGRFFIVVACYPEGQP